MGPRCVHFMFEFKKKMFLMMMNMPSVCLWCGAVALTSEVLTESQSPVALQL